MKQHSTNYFNTFIEVAANTKAVCGVAPPVRQNRTIAERQYSLISAQPYQFTSDEILFQIYADRNDLGESEYLPARDLFFSKGQACLRASPLTKNYGFGVHFDHMGRVAIYGMETEAYENFLKDQQLVKVRAMRS
ncbi:DUF6157 family protein [Dyadobacter tibetensis]|uniref:DUF6157 family protein n=1 Tax=Dyadobacter tibetensis TaxID=1211851 RepID=UPI0004B251B4|nr:DUF6157 family protein [Dyadobacter tibetensis]